MMKQLSNFYFIKVDKQKVRWSLTNVKAGARSDGLPTNHRDTASPSMCHETGPTHFRLSASAPGRLLYLFITVFFIINTLCSCSNKNNLPNGVLSKDEMAKILTELYLKEARINNIHVDQDSSRKLMEYYRYQYAKQTGIPDSVVEASYQYYLAHPIELGEIYDRVIDTLALKEQRISPYPGSNVIE